MPLFRSRRLTSQPEGVELAPPAEPNEDANRRLLPWWLLPAVTVIPAALIYATGDTVAAVMWAVVFGVGLIGGWFGCCRPIAWMVSTPIAFWVGERCSGSLATSIAETFPRAEPAAAPLATGLIALVVLVVLHLVVCRTIYRRVAANPKLRRVDFAGGYLLAGGKMALLGTTLLALLIYADENPQWKRTALGRRVPQPVHQKIQTMSTQTRQSMVVTLVDQIDLNAIDWQQLADKTKGFDNPTTMMSGHMPTMGAAAKRGSTGPHPALSQDLWNQLPLSGL